MEGPRRQPQPIGTSSTGASHPAKGTGAAYDGGKLEAQAAMHGGGCNATPQGHKQGAQRTHSGGNVGTATRVKTPYRGVKMANKAYDRKAPGIHREQRETPHSASHAGRWSFLAFGQVEKQKNRLQQDIQQDQGRHLLVSPARYAAFSRSVCSSSVRVLAIMSAICCLVLYRTAIPTLVTSSSW